MTIWILSAPSWAVLDPNIQRDEKQSPPPQQLGAPELIASRPFQDRRAQSTALRARFVSGGFSLAHHHLIKVTLHLFFGAAELSQV
jgi:hypothetical protein